MNYELNGAGLGLRHPHYDDVIRDKPRVDWFEIVSDNYFAPQPGSYPELLRIRAEYQIAIHGVGLSIAGTDELCPRYLASLKHLVSWLEPCVVSDHISWSRHGGFAVQDLLPVAYTQATLDHVARRVDAVQVALGRTLVLENPSAYVNFASSTMTEADFLKALSARTGCQILLDVNNLFVTERNLGVDPRQYLKTIAGASVAYMHLAGHSVHPGILIDDHGGPVSDGVAALFREAVRTFPEAGLLLEWDNNLPPFATLVAEMERSKGLRAEALKEAVECLPPASVASHHRTARAEVVQDLSQWKAAQDTFWRAVTKPQSSRQDLAFVGRSAEVFAESPATSEAGLRVYSNVHSRRYLRELSAAYQGLAELLAGGPFAALVQAYVESLAAPVKPEDAAYGFADFLPGAAVLPGFPLPLEAVVEVAVAERARRRLIALPVQRGLSPAILAKVAATDWPTLVMHVSPSCFRQDRHYDVTAMVRASRDRRASSALSRSTVATSWILYRTGDGVAPLLLSPEESRFFDALAAGHSFAAASAAHAGGFTVVDDDLAAVQVGCLDQWLKLGLFVGFHLDVARPAPDLGVALPVKGLAWIPSQDA